MTNIVIHQNESRGLADFGWLISRHTFSFGSYYDPERMNFGVLRVLNDDIVSPGRGFDMHRHENMEIISIPLSGDLEHKDSLGNKAIIRSGDVQVMSAGTGIFHSEYNKNEDQEVSFLQIWVIPNKLGVEPRYGQVTLHEADRVNRLQQIISPEQNNGGLWIHQDAWLYLSNLEKDKQLKYTLKSNDNGVYIFLIKGTIEVNGLSLNERDGIGIKEGLDTISMIASNDAFLLLMELPI